jgi:hypothetical protein
MLIDNECLINKYIDDKLTEAEFVDMQTRIVKDNAFAEMLEDYLQTEVLFSKISTHVREKKRKEFLAGYNEFLTKQNSDKN